MKDLYDMVKFVRIGEELVELNNENLIDYQMLINAHFDKITVDKTGNIGNFGVKKSLVDNLKINGPNVILTLSEEGVNYCQESGLFNYKVSMVNLDDNIDITGNGRVRSIPWGKVIKKEDKPSVLASNYFSSESAFDPENFSDEHITGSRNDIKITHDKDGNIKSIADTFNYATRYD